MTEKLPASFSVYLDALRVVAAATVLFSHYPLTAAQGAVTDRINFAYDAVIVFFVLSGLVISHAVDTKERDGFNYWVNRAARILPVSIAAVLLSLLLMAWGSQHHANLYPDAFQLDNIFYYFFRTVTFTNEFWWDDIRPFGNGPYWSLAFEVWCYIIFGLAMFTRGRWRIALLLSALLITGPKQWIILPMWLAGVATYHYRDAFKLSRGWQWVLCLGPIGVFFAVQLNNPRDWSYPVVGVYVESLFGHGLDGAANFGWGYLLALLVCTHLFAVRQLCRSSTFNAQGRAANLIRQLAGYTFSLYIFHYPLLNFWRAMHDQARYSSDFADRALIYAATLIPIVLLAQLLERRKKYFRQVIIRAVDFARRLGVKRMS